MIIWPVDYVLVDPSELHRLSICSVPQPFPRRFFRAPVPWATSYRDVKLWQSQHLFAVTHIMLLLQEMWLNR